MCITPWFKSDIRKWLPCNGCVGCRIDRVALWSARASSEMVKGRNAFLTFTYDDYHLPYNDGALLPTLKADTAHKYLDNLRSKVRKMAGMPIGCRKDYKYYLVGEYGDSFKRPHYHSLFFGLDFSDFNLFFADSWHNGSIKSLPVVMASIRYVLDYMFKSTNGSFAEIQYDNTNRERPFTMSSNGFGLDFFSDHADEINLTGFITICGRHVPVPTYYKNMFCRYDKKSVESRQNALNDFLFDCNNDAKSKGYKNLDDFTELSRQVFYDSFKARNVDGIDASFIPDFVNKNLELSDLLSSFF